MAARVSKRVQFGNVQSTDISREKSELVIQGKDEKQQTRATNFSLKRPMLSEILEKRLISLVLMAEKIIPPKILKGISMF